MSNIILIDECSQWEVDPISEMLERIRDEKECGIIIESFNSPEHAQNVKDIIIGKVNVGTEGHCDYGNNPQIMMTTMKHDWVRELKIMENYEEFIKEINKLKCHEPQDECQGNFKKITKGNRHTYPFWHKGEY